VFSYGSGTGTHYDGIAIAPTGWCGRIRGPGSTNCLDRTSNTVARRDRAREIKPAGCTEPTPSGDRTTCSRIWGGTSGKRSRPKPPDFLRKADVDRQPGFVDRVPGEITVSLPRQTEGESWIRRRAVRDSDQRVHDAELADSRTSVIPVAVSMLAFRIPHRRQYARARCFDGSERMMTDSIDQVCTTRCFRETVAESWNCHD